MDVHFMKFFCKLGHSFTVWQINIRLVQNSTWLHTKPTVCADTYFFHL